jgi:hypothetical protein
MIGAMKRSLGFGVLLVLAVVSCKKNDEPAAASSEAPVQAVAEAPPQKAADAGPSKGPEGLDIAWQVPEGWRSEKPKSAMRKATYGVPRAAGDKEDAELAVFYFGADQGGSIEANADRWIKQFADAAEPDVRRSDREANGLRQHLVEVVKGTFSSGMPGDTGSKPNYGMVAAIVEAPSGPYFFKLTGPSETVLAARPALLALLDSIQPTQ